MLPLAPTRHARRRLIGIGAVLGASVIAGSLFALTGITTVIGIFLTAYGSAVAASRAPGGLFALTLCLPVAAIGLSYPPGEACALGVVFLASAAFSYIALLAWPEFPTKPSRPQPLLPKPFARRYGLLAGLAGATSALAGLAVHTDHLGWAPAAGYFVLRPSADMQRLRSTGRIISVACGATAGVVFVRTTPSATAIGVCAVLAVAGAAATRTSHWYVGPAFGSLLGLTLLLYADPSTANEQWRLNQRIGMTAVGVASAYLYGVLVPRLIERARTAHV
jgi:hypothetical protein